MKVQIEHVSLGFIKEINNNVCSLAVQKNIMCFTLRSGQMFSINLEDPSKVFRLDLPILVANQEKILEIWMNVQGTRALIKTNFAKYYACNLQIIMNAENNISKNGKDNQYVLLKKFNRKEYDVISVDWSFSEYELLLGTRQGKIYYMDLSQADPTAVKVFNCDSPIDGLKWYSDGEAVIVAGNSYRYWEPTENSTPLTFCKHHPNKVDEFGATKKDQVCKFAVYNQDFAWITQAGILLGNIGDGYAASLSKSLLLLNELPPSKNKIRDLLLTEYHLILLRGSEILIINKINNKVVFQDIIFSKEDERMLSLCADYSQTPPTFWCHSTENIYEIVIENELDGIWQLLCANGKFDAALNLAGLSSSQLDYVREKHADALYADEKWLDSAREYGLIKQGAAVGSIALKFMNFPDLIYLQTFLITKLETLKKASTEIQKFIISSWIIWNFMNQLNQAEEALNEENNDVKLDDLKTSKSNLEKEFRQFVKENLQFLDKETVYQIISQQNRKSELLYFANLMEDYEYVLSYWIRSDNWYESLKVLVTLQDAESIYKYASVLLINSPAATINAWMQVPDVDPVELIPSMLTYFSHFQEQQKLSLRPLQNYALTYLKRYIKERKPEDSLIHNTVIFMLLAPKVDSETDGEQEAIKFINEHPTRFDPNFVLRLSLKLERYSVAIRLYSQLKLYDDAVDLALSKGMVSSAKMIVTTLETENTQILKKLWLKIARVTIHSNEDVHRSIRSIIQESNEVLTIKDLLPLFNELTTIADLKDELVRSLEGHRVSMTHIYQEINNCIKIKKEIRQDIDLFSKRHKLLKPGVSCDICRHILTTRKFFVFPCGHNFHTDCIIKEIIKSNNFNMRSKIESFQKTLLRTGKHSMNVAELDKLLSAKCCLCSDIKINTIDEPLQDENEEEEAAAWEV
ncbi:HBR105Wp [Eremothecium sinecaudum]|uniref:HBR105Wp n=1 Tax=Eremothecium sinecaudum TaxID=45286 RepID=A0A120K157_9SACH|nr:HBR105Wp [Eremothecium sinecaudum]AMD19006.1 HBR105Wp [Eremothecium sinecaudum]